MLLLGPSEMSHVVFSNSMYFLSFVDWYSCAYALKVVLKWCLKSSEVPVTICLGLIFIDKPPFAWKAFNHTTLYCTCIIIRIIGSLLNGNLLLCPRMRSLITRICLPISGTYICFRMLYLSWSSIGWSRLWVFQIHCPSVKL